MATTKIKTEPGQEEATPEVPHVIQPSTSSDNSTTATITTTTTTATNVNTNTNDNNTTSNAEVLAKADEIYNLCKNAGNKGVQQNVLSQAMPNVEPKILVEAINVLLQKGSIELAKKGNTMVYRAKSSSSDVNRGTGDEEQVVYLIVQASGNKGIWLRDIRIRSNLSTTELNKVIKSMESKKIIKAVKSVSASKKKLYMLYELQPDSSVTGGAWYSAEQSFETEFVEILSQQCHKFLLERRKLADEGKESILKRRKASLATSLEVLQFIEKSKISRVQLSQADIEMILEKLVYDGLAERRIVTHSNEGDVKSYRSTNQFVTSTGLMKMPCGVCPVSSDCHDHGDITPVKCIYFSEWF